MLYIVENLTLCSVAFYWFTELTAADCMRNIMHAHFYCFVLKKNVTCFKKFLEVFHVYLNNFEIVVSHFVLIILSNNKFTLVNLQECEVTKKIALNFIRWIKTVSEDE